MTAISKVLTGMIEGRMVGYHLAAILAGYLLDLCLGDPHSMPHPVRAIGNLIVWLEKYLRGTRQDQYADEIPFFL